MRRDTQIEATSQNVVLFQCCFWLALALAIAGCDAVPSGTLGLVGAGEPSNATKANNESYALIGERLLNVTADEGVLANDAASRFVEAMSGETEFGGTLQLNDDGSFAYEAPEDFFGTDKFDYRVETNNGTIWGTASIKVYPADATPVP